MEELFYTCPYCFTEVSILADPSVAQQEYIEDCERCCNPIEFSLSFENGELQYFDQKPIEQ